MSLDDRQLRKKVFARGRGGKEPQHLQDQAIFHALLENHHLLKRYTTRLPNGIEAKTIVNNGDKKLV